VDPEPSESPADASLEPALLRQRSGEGLRGNLARGIKRNEARGSTRKAGAERRNRIFQNPPVGSLRLLRGPVPSKCLGERKLRLRERLSVRHRARRGMVHEGSVQQGGRDSALAQLAVSVGQKLEQDRGFAVISHQALQTREWKSLERLEHEYNRACSISHQHIDRVPHQLEGLVNGSSSFAIAQRFSREAQESKPRPDYRVLQQDTGKTAQGEMQSTHVP